MPVNLTIFVVVWAVFASIVVGLAIYRRVVAAHEDDTLHVLEAEAGMIAQQEMIARRLEVIDKWGKLLTIVTLVYGLLLACVYLYQVWEESFKTLAP